MPIEPASSSVGLELLMPVLSNRKLVKFLFLGSVYLIRVNSMFVDVVLLKLLRLILGGLTVFHQKLAIRHKLRNPAFEP